MAIHKFNELQLSFELELDETEADREERMISPEEARLINEAAKTAFEGGEKLPEWFRDYQKLIEKGWPWRVACYMAWASSPRERRWPEKLGELATGVLGLKSARVIYTWRKKYPSIDTIVAMLQAAVLWEHRRDVFEALVEMAKRPDYKAFNDRKLFLEMVGDYTPRSQLQVNRSGAADELSELSDEELRLMAGETPSQTLPGEQSSLEGGGEEAPSQPPDPLPGPPPKGGGSREEEGE